MPEPVKIIIGVDDVAENRAILQAVVEKQGLMFFGAESGIACLRLVARLVPKLVLLDVQMPGMDGFETCRRLRLMPGMRHVGVAFLTALNGMDHVRTGIAAGGNDFIAKPFDHARLLQCIAQWTKAR